MAGVGACGATAGPAACDGLAGAAGLAAGREGASGSETNGAAKVGVSGATQTAKAQGIRLKAYQQGAKQPRSGGAA